jgi:hypothetical protein
MNRKDIIPLALASGFERVEKEYQFMPDTYEVSASDLELFVEKLTRKPLTDEDISAIVQSMSAYTWDAHMLARAIERAHGITE